MLREPRAHVLSQYKMCRSQWVEEFRQATRQKGQHVPWRHKGSCPVVVDHYTLLLTMMEWGAYRTRSYPYSAYQTGVVLPWAEMNDVGRYQCRYSRY